MSEITKAYEPQAVEEKWYERWLKADAFKADPSKVTPERPAYSIVIPPPNVTGVLTLGHVLNNTVQDILARRARMQGNEVLWLPGTDHAGIATQAVVERQLRREGAARRDLGREKFIQRVWEWKEKHGGIIIEQLKKLGCSCDWSRERFTMDPEYSGAVSRVFVQLYEEGLIYRGRRMVNWDPAARTALSDEEVIMKPAKGTLYYLRYELVDEAGTFLEVATTRPETLMGDTAVAVHPDDVRYQRFIGQKVWRPFPRAAIPIIADAGIDPVFGTGVLKVTPAHDKADFEIGERHQLEIIDVLHPNGTMNELAGKEFAGLDRFVARTAAVEKLRDLNLLVREEPHDHNVGYSERTDAPVEPRLSVQWFLRYPKVAESLAAVKCGAIRFRPEHWEAVFENWLANIQDWCISRQLWWGHRIPAWYRKDDPSEVFVGLAPPPDVSKWVQDEDVLDTWFSAWLWPFETMDGPTRAVFYPTQDLVTGPDIIFFWVARMIMAGFHFTGKKPFAHVFFTGLIRDGQGRKMSKSLGNSPDPLELISRYGADGVRFGLVRIAPHGQDIRFDEKQIEEGRNFANKLWNACRFREMQGPAEPVVTLNDLDLSPFAIHIVHQLDQLIVRLEEAYAGDRFSEAAQLLYDFFWGDYCDRFVEAAKSEITAEATDVRRMNLAVMDHVLSAVLRLLHPFMPHITEELWERMGFGGAAGRGASLLMFAALPSVSFLARANVASASQEAALIYQMASQGRNLRAEYRIPSNRKVNFILKATGALSEGSDPALRVLTRLLNAESVSVQPGYEPPRGVPVILTGRGALYMPLEGLIDVEAEQARLKKEITKVEAELQTVRRKLEQPSFVENAPPEVVNEHRERERAWLERLTQLRKMRENLGS